MNNFLENNLLKNIKIKNKNVIKALKIIIKKRRKIKIKVLSN